MNQQTPFPESVGDRYRMVSRIGTGGMGVVYQATDTKLNRAVAIKLIHSHRLREGRDRLRDEALAAASINHPYLCKVYEFIDEGDDAFLVMEFIEGETLSRILERGLLPLSDTLRIVSGILQALATAHDHGLVHRDVKPSNVMVTSDGHIKLLDFGLALPDAIRTPAESTRTSPAGAGRDHAGTPHYMAPEQALGRPVTARSDLFAVGALLYECVSGRLPFTGSSGYDYVRHMLSDKPRPLARSAPDVPADLAGLIDRCLEKTPANRPESARAVLGELQQIEDALSNPDTALRTARGARARRRVWRGGLVAAVGIVLVFFGWRWIGPPEPPAVESVRRSLITWPSAESESRVSPDGRWVAFLSSRGGSPRAYVVPIDGGDENVVRLPAGSPQSLTWSPDGNLLAFALLRPNDFSLQVATVPAFGGPVRTNVSIGRTRSQVRLIRWIDRSIYVQVGRALHRLDLDQEEMEPVTDAWSVDGFLRYFDVSPDGGRVAYTLTADGQTDLWVADLDGSRVNRLTSDEASDRFPVWGPSGRRIVYQSDLRGQLDLWEWTLDAGSASPLTISQATDTPGGISTDGAVLSFTRAFDESHLWQWSVDDPGGVPLTADTLSDFSPSLSGDGRIIAFQRNQPVSLQGSLTSSTLFVSTVGEDGRLQDPREVGPGFAGLLSRDGNWLAYRQRGTEPLRDSLLITHLETQETHPVSTRAPQLSFFRSPADWDEHNVAWSRTEDALYFVEQVDDTDRQSLRRHRVGSTGGEALLAETEPGETIRDIFPTADGRALAYLLYSADDHALHRVDLDTGEDVVLATFRSASNTVFGRGWLDDDRTFVVLQRQSMNEDESADIDVLLVTVGGEQRVAGTLEHAFVGTARLDSTAAALYVARSEAGVHNLYRFSINSTETTSITSNTLEGVVFSAPELDGAGRIVGARNKRTRDIWLIDARPGPGSADESGG